MPKPSPLVASDWHTSESRWDWFFLVMLTGLLAFMPFSLGAVEAWSELVVVCAALLLAIGLLLRVWFDSTFQLARSWTYLPLTAVLALIVVQCVPLPPSLVSSLSPKSVELRQELLGVITPEVDGASAANGAPAAADGQTTLSLYPYETSHDLRMALVFAVLFVTVASVFRTSAQIKLAILVVFVIGCVEAGVALLQILTLSTKIHWMYAERGQIVTSGSFINYSHLCQFLNLTLGAGVALLLIRMKEDSRRDRGGASRLTDLCGDRYLRPLSGIVLCAVAICTSMSRNGAISLLIASGVIGLLLYRRGVLSARGWLMGMAPWCVLLVLFFTSFDKVYDRFATLEDQQHLQQRIEMTAGTLRAWRDFPVLGSGLGTHENVFPLYDKAVSTSMAEHADNDWAQLLEEFGLLGAGAVLAFVLSVFWVAGKLIFSGQTTLSTAAFGLSLGLLATAWHSLSDFGQHLPGIFSVTAVISGLLVAIARFEIRKNREQSTEDPNPYLRPPKYQYLLGVPASAGLLLFGWWAGAGAVAAYRGETWANVAQAFEQRLQAEDWPASDQHYIDLLTVAQLATEAEPNNVKHGYLLNLYRWRSISRARDPENGTILLDPGVLPFVSQIAEEVARVRSLCPTYGPPYALEGELRLLVLGQPAGSQLIAQAARLTPYHASTSFIAGQLAAREGRLNEAVALLNRTVALEPGKFRAVASLYLNEFQRPDLAQQLAGDNYGKMVQLGRMLEAPLPDSDEPTKAKYAELAEKLHGHALTRLRELVSSGKASAGEMANLAAVEVRDHHPQAAIDLYQRALAHRYGQIRWRLALAKALVEVGEMERALREARIILRFKPQSRAAKQLIEEISVLPVNPPSE